KGRESVDVSVSQPLNPVVVSQLPALPNTVGMTVIAGDHKVRLQWLVPSSSQDFKFNVYRRDAAPIEGDYVGAILLGVGPQPGEFSGLLPGQMVVHQQEDSSAVNKKSYYYSIAAVTGAGEGVKSAEWLVTPFRALNPNGRT